jgi:hypothetical protein
MNFLFNAERAKSPQSTLRHMKNCPPFHQDYCANCNIQLVGQFVWGNYFLNDSAHSAWPQRALR